MKNVEISYVLRSEWHNSIMGYFQSKIDNDESKVDIYFGCLLSLDSIYKRLGIDMPYEESNLMDHLSNIEANA